MYYHQPFFGPASIVSMAQSTATAASHHKRKRPRQSSGAGGSTTIRSVKDMPTVEMREALNRDTEMGRVLLERGYLGSKLYNGPDVTTGLLPGRHDQILAEMKWVHADVAGLRDLKQAQCRRVASAIKEYWRVRTKQQEHGGGQHVRLDGKNEVREQLQRAVEGSASSNSALTSSPNIDTMMKDSDEITVSSDEAESQFSNAAEARATIDPLRDVIDRLNDSSAVWMSDKGPPIKSTGGSSSSSSAVGLNGSSSPGGVPIGDEAVCSTVFVPGVVDFPKPGAEPRLRMNELLSNQRTLLHEMQFSEAARARLPALFTTMVREMSPHQVGGDQDSVIRTPRSTTSAVAKAKARGRKGPAGQQQQYAVMTVTQAWEEKENLFLLAALARSLPRCFNHKSSSTYFMVERRREALRGSAAANLLQDESLDLASGLLHGVNWRSVEIGMRCAAEGMAAQDKLRSHLACARRANEMLTERPMLPPPGTRWRGSLPGVTMVGDRTRHIGTPCEVALVEEEEDGETEAATPAIEDAMREVEEGVFEKSVQSQEDALLLFHYRRGLTTPTFAAYCPRKLGITKGVIAQRGQHRGRSVKLPVSQRWKLPRVRKCIRKVSCSGAPPSDKKKRRLPSTVTRSSMTSRLASPVSFSESLKSWDEYIATVSHQSSCRWLTNAVTSLSTAHRRRATECEEGRVFQWESPPPGTSASPLALRNAHANALVALQRYSASYNNGVPSTHPTSCIGPDAMKLLTHATHKLKAQMADNGAGVEVAPTKQVIPENYRRTKIVPNSMGSGRPASAATGPTMMGAKAPSPQQMLPTAMPKQGGMVMPTPKTIHPGGGYPPLPAGGTSTQSQQPQHLAQLLQIRNAAAAAAAAAAANQHGNPSQQAQQQQQMQQYLMAKRGQMQQPPQPAYQKPPHQAAFGKAPSAQRVGPGGGTGLGSSAAMPKVSPATMQSLLQSMLTQQAAQRMTPPLTAASSPSPQSHQPSAMPASNSAAASLGNLQQLYQNLLAQFTHGSVGMRRSGAAASQSGGGAAVGSNAAGMGAGSNTMPAIQNMLQSIIANAHHPQQYGVATPKGAQAGMRPPTTASTAAPTSLQQQQQQRSPYQQLYFANAASGGAPVLPKAATPGAKAPTPAATTPTAAAGSASNRPSGSGGG